MDGTSGFNSVPSVRQVAKIKFLFPIPIESPGDTGPPDSNAATVYNFGD